MAPVVRRRVEPAAARDLVPDAARDVERVAGADVAGGVRRQAPRRLARREVRRARRERRRRCFFMIGLERQRRVQQRVAVVAVARVVERAVEVQRRRGRGVAAVGLDGAPP